MNGAQALIDTLYKAGVRVCFANPGTSEMQLVAAIDKHPEMRGVLGLFEGVVTGAADGYGRMADAPAATLLHLGPGFANGAANLHNARRAHAPVVNIVGDHADYHREYDAPLTSDLEGAARPFSNWVKTSASADALAGDGAQAVAEAMRYPGAIATLIAPANFAWEDAKGAAEPQRPQAAPQADAALIEKAAAALKSGKAAALFLGGMALREDALEEAGRISEATGARIICETFAARLQRGEGRVPVERLPYFGEMAAEFLSGFSSVVFIGAKPPVAFFAYPGKPGRLSPEDAEIFEVADARTDALSALRALADALNAPKTHSKRQPHFVPPPMSGKLEPAGVAAALAELSPEDAIIIDEAATAGLAMFPMTAGMKRHDWLMLTGGSIGFGLPAGVGAAIARPDRKVICLQADGSAMYTVQALWTMAREKLDITTVIFNNASYAILNIELARVGAGNPGPKALSLLDLSNPMIDWVEISNGMGVPGVRATTAESFRDALKEALEARGPRLVEADLRP
ncbi:MAG: acetolactate synthase large subunit [Parvularculaceae bacterium]|nr:acetolactate synthase large subunit [Parvularculaceae bacterium]